MTNVRARVSHTRSAIMSMAASRSSSGQGAWRAAGGSARASGDVRGSAPVRGCALGARRALADGALGVILDRLEPPFAVVRAVNVADRAVRQIERDTSPPPAVRALETRVRSDAASRRLPSERPRSCRRRGQRSKKPTRNLRARGARRRPRAEPRPAPGRRGALGLLRAGDGRARRAGRSRPRPPRGSPRAPVAAPGPQEVTGRYGP